MYFLRPHIPGKDVKIIRRVGARGLGVMHNRIAAAFTEWPEPPACTFFHFPCNEMVYGCRSLVHQFLDCASQFSFQSLPSSSFAKVISNAAADPKLTNTPTLAQFQHPIFAQTLIRPGKHWVHVFDMIVRLCQNTTDFLRAIKSPSVYR